MVITRKILITGQVQGVGFRPFVYNLACRLGLSGEVANGARGVEILAQGPVTVLDHFESLLLSEQPAMAFIDHCHSEDILLGEIPGFSIVSSQTGELDLGVTPDAAVCDDCLSDLFDPENRRFLYPFINCTNCGPRYSLIKALPYDRENTTMAEFDLCHGCEEEYQDPADRRFHAQPVACETCGPHLRFESRSYDQEKLAPVDATVAMIQQGGIVAVKGVGGFHLVCDARNEQAIAKLRSRKQRDEKPFAIMALNPASLKPVVELNEERVQRLKAMDASITLLPLKQRETVEQTLPSNLAPALGWLGVMLPHSPLHFLLFHAAAGKPDGKEWLSLPQLQLFVMTSGNVSGNPLITDDQQALTELAGIADGFLLHNRPIYRRCDDSVLTFVKDKPALIRRGRGLSPQCIPLSPESADTEHSILAVGGYFKNTVCLTKGSKAYVSQYIGDLDNPECCRNLIQTVEDLKKLLDIEPDLVVSDLHPEFFSSVFAEGYAKEHELPLVKVQHHHAHLASVMAEHQLQGPALGLALDGLGMGDDGALWGGELFKVSQGEYLRLGHLSTLPLPGGDKAAKEPWRIACGALYQMGKTEEIERRFSGEEAVHIVTQLLEKQLNTPMASSAGRLFDAAAALLGVKSVSNYEAQAAMMLESLAYEYLSQSPSPNEPLWVERSDAGLNVLPLLARLTEIEDAGYGAALFHIQLVRGLSIWCSDYAEQLQLSDVALSGGCFLNQLLLSELSQSLAEKGLRVYTPEKLPCNDGGIALGQAYVALKKVGVGTNNDKKISERVCA